MGAIMYNLWTSETSGPRLATRLLDAIIAIVGIICIATGSRYPVYGSICYIILGIAALLSLIISAFIYSQKLFHPGFLILPDFALAAVHWIFGISYALSANFSQRGGVIIAVFLLIVAVLHTLFFVSVCRDTHVRRQRSNPTARTKNEAEMDV
ncbi:hypothetical protein N7532_009975 [Penicillium argentinense]|uniref:Uncharacterized protein n=1 Tax=Penicillium argentinense TaxID=1131581 RepID=A0A9W9ENY1_9EURO|nr:uncharacterized protein N7532_009975 [Penicillium argentinense]KAJ5085204.1 hypothetical protein N7532_009975 [Penicillium argentinense]